MEPLPTRVGRALVEQTPTELRIIIASKRPSGFVVAIQVSILAFVLFQIRRGLATDNPYLAAVLSTVFTSLYLIILLWSFAGKEILTLNPDVLVYRKQVSGIGWSWHYKLSGVSNFRYVSSLHMPKYSDNRTLAFDYEFMPRRFGGYLSKQEVEDLIRILDGYVQSHGSRVVHNTVTKTNT